MLLNNLVFGFVSIPTCLFSCLHHFGMRVLSSFPILHLIHQQPRSTETVLFTLEPSPLKTNQNSYIWIFETIVSAIMVLGDKTRRGGFKKANFVPEPEIQDDQETISD